MARLEGKVAIVTGAAGGIGEAVCRRFAEEGAAILCVDIDADSLNAVVADVSSRDGRALAHAGDVAEELTAQSAVAHARSEFGRIDVLVCSAVSDLPLGPLTEISHADWRRSMAVNLDSAFLFAKHAIPEISANGGGSIILIASELARVAKPGRTWYCAQKSALVGLARALAVDHANQHIRVNSLSPGPIETERYLRKFETLESARASSETLFDRLGSPDEIAASAVFLASDEASFINGSDLLVDGGRTAV